jgi:hypothetical protein
MRLVELAASELDRRWIRAARLLWYSLAMLGVYLILSFSPLHLDQLAGAAPQSTNSLLQIYSLSPAEVETLKGAGFSPRLYAWLVLVLELTWVLVFLLPATIIILRRPGERMALFAAFALLLQGMFTTPLIFTTLAYHPVWRIPVAILAGLGLASLISLLYLFPDGRFVPAWTRSLAGLAYLLAPATTMGFVFNPDLSYHSSALITILPLGVLNFGGMLSQVYRYRRVSLPHQRQQTKWVMLSILLMSIGILLVVVMILVFLSDIRSNANRLLFLALSLPLNVLAVALIPLSISFAVLRYRLWDIDLIIRRTLVYSLLSASLAMVYLSSVLLLQTLVSSFLDLSQPVVTVTSTLAVAALFTPLRRRIQRLIDRRFYRQKYDADQVLARFNMAVRDEVDLDQLREHILQGVEETVQPTQAWLWLREAPGPENQS